MPLACSFELNGQPMSTLSCGAIGNFPAFSGMNVHRNKRTSVAVPDAGPLPTGRYYILQRETGGRMGWFHDLFAGSDKDEWFALYRDDGSIDDTTFVENVRRGAFRLHPVGPRGISEGCITLSAPADFQRLRAELLKGKARLDNGSRAFDYFGIVEVK